MNKLLGVLAFVVVILIAFMTLKNRNGGHSFPSELVEIETNLGTKVFAKLSGGEEQFLNSVSEFDDGKIKVDVPIGADVILRYYNKEEIFAYEIWKEEKFIPHDFNTLISIQINAVPWAYVFIKLPDGDDFIKPRRQDFIITPGPDERDTNVTPIPGGLKVSIGTEIKLVHEDKEKVFFYETLEEEKFISHDFSNQ